MKHYALFWAVILCIFSACRKDVDVFEPVHTEYIENQKGNIEIFFAQVRNDYKKIYPVKAGQELLFTEKDIVIRIPPAAFVDQSGAPVTSAFELHLKELKEKGEMILSGQPTLSEGKLIISAAELYIEAWKGSQQLRLADGMQLQIFVPSTQLEDGMELFYGVEQDQRVFSWDQADGDPQSWSNVIVTEWTFQQDTQTLSDVGYMCFVDRLDWINIDIFYVLPEEAKTSVCIELPEEYSNKNTIVYLVFDEFSSFTTLYGQPEIRQFCEPHGLVPIGSEVKFIVVSEQSSGEYHFAVVEAVVEKDHYEAIFPEEVNFESIKDYLSQL